MKLKISHNLDEVQLEQALEKALKGIRGNAENPDAPLPDNLSESIRSDAFDAFGRITRNMLREIEEVIKKE